MSTLESENRYMPMNWVPRWFEAYYNTDSILRKWYFLGLYYYSDLMKEIIRDQIVPHFFGQIWEDRYLLVAHYHYPLTYIPHVSVFTSGNAASATVRCTDSSGSMLYEFTDPVYYRGDTNLYLKNLDVRSVSACAISGAINLTTFFSQEAIDDDSPIFIENQYGDFSFIDQFSTRYIPASSIVLVPYDGLYTIYYRSVPRLESFITGNSYITIDGLAVDVHVHYTDNIWDNFAQLENLTRNKFESNRRLKARCQFMTIAKFPNQRIAASLGQAVGINWYTSGSAVSGSSFNDWQFQGYTSRFYFTETPIKSGNNYVLSYPPTGYVQAFLNGNLICDDSFTVSGSYIISNTPLLAQSTAGNLSVTYKTQVMRDREYPETGNIVAILPDGLQYRGILIKDSVFVTNTTKRINSNEWLWNSNLGLLGGLAGFW